MTRHKIFIVLNYKPNFLLGLLNFELLQFYQPTIQKASSNLQEVLKFSKRVEVTITFMVVISEILVTLRARLETSSGLENLPFFIEVFSQKNYTVNRYRRGLVTCPQAKTSKSGQAIFFFFSNAFEYDSAPSRKYSLPLLNVFACIG